MSNWVYHFSGFVLDPSERRLHLAGQPVTITPKAFDILLALVERHGRVVTKDELLALVWPETFVEETNLAYNISLLRKSLGDSAEEPLLIETIPRRGYRFIAPVSTSPKIAENAASVVAPDSSAGQIETQAGPWRRLWPLGIALGAAVLLLAGGWNLASRRSPPSDLIERKLVLIARFENHSGDAELDGILETVLKSELLNSQYLGVASPQRINDVLRLMRQPQTTRVPAALVAEICQRDPAIRAAVAGSISRIGNSFLLTAEITQPEDGRSIASITRTARDRDGILSEAGNLAAAVREGLVENVLHRSAPEPSPRRVTTSSLSALKFYGDALQDAIDNRWAEAEVLLRHAVEIDPQFASALTLLSWCIHNQHPAASSEYMPFALRAFHLSQGTSDHESLFIGASYYSLSGDHRRSIPYYESLVRDYPEDPWALRNLLIAYSQTRQYAQSSTFARKLTSVRPNDPAAYLTAAPRYLCSPDPDPGRVQSLLDQGLELARRQGNSKTLREYQLQRAYYMAVADWVAGDVRKCKAHLEEMTKQLPPDDPWSGYAGTGYLTLGHMAEADRWLKNYPNIRIRRRWSTMRALLAGDMETARQIAATMRNEESNPLSSIAMMRAGEMDSAARMIKGFGNAFYTDSATVARYELSLRQTGVFGPVDALADAVRSLSESEFSEHWIGARLLAEAYAAHGDVDRAISILEETDSPARACGGFLVASFWPQARFDLMQLYRRRGRIKEAERIRAELQNLLSLGDGNHVVLAALKQH